MPKKQNLSKNTRERLIESACTVFAEKGYREATIAEICEHAGANGAAVNYYFGDKKRLYDQVWRHAYETAIETHPLDAVVGHHPSAEGRLALFVSGMLRIIFGKDHAGHFVRLMARELFDPTCSHGVLVDKMLINISERLNNIISILLGANVTSQQIHFCVLSVISQCLFLNLNTPLKPRLFNEEEFDPKPIKALAEHITRFSLAGISKAKQSGLRG